MIALFYFMLKLKVNRKTVIYLHDFHIVRTSAHISLRNLCSKLVDIFGQKIIE